MPKPIEYYHWFLWGDICFAEKARWCEGPGDFREGLCFVSFPCRVLGNAQSKKCVGVCVGGGMYLQPVTHRGEPTTVVLA